MSTKLNMQYIVDTIGRGEISEFVTNTVLKDINNFGIFPSWVATANDVYMQGKTNVGYFIVKIDPSSCMLYVNEPLNKKSVDYSKEWKTFRGHFNASDYIAWLTHKQELASKKSEDAIAKLRKETEEKISVINELYDSTKRIIEKETVKEKALYQGYLNTVNCNDSGIIIEDGMDN